MPIYARETPTILAHVGYFRTLGPLKQIYILTTASFRERLILVVLVKSRSLARESQGVKRDPSRNDLRERTAALSTVAIVVGHGPTRGGDTLSCTRGYLAYTARAPYTLCTHDPRETLHTHRSASAARNGTGSPAR